MVQIKHTWLVHGKWKTYWYTKLIKTPSIIQSETEEIWVEFAESEPSNSASISVRSSTRRPSESLDPLTLIIQLSNVNEKILLHNHGYKKIDTVCDTLQGQLYKAITINQPDNNQTFVAIKKTEKYLFNEKLSVQDNINFCVSENIYKEAQILKYLTVDNRPIGDYIVKYIDFFESDTDYYLVVEYIESTMNMKQFINKCKQYIQNGQLPLKEYQKIIKYLLWQLFVTIQWMHISMNTCHMDLCTENIMIQCDNPFISNGKNGLKINPNICIKICDFGVSECFQIENLNHSNSTNNRYINSFLCSKFGLSLENEGYSSPKVFDGEVFDARSADNWMLGMILFECMTIGKYLYKPLDIYKISSGRRALKTNQLKQYLLLNNLLKYFNNHSFSILSQLLQVNDTKRLKGMNILMHQWFHMYFNRYKKQILKKFYTRNKPSIGEMDFYQNV